MRAIILAAGFGQRLRPLTDTKPKAMVEILGRTILRRQIDLFKSFGLTSIIVVGGHGFDSLTDIDCLLVKNSNYSTTNMVYSLLSAREYFDDELIVSYGDILYEPAILETLMSSAHNISVAVDMNWRSYWEERFDDPLCDAETLRIGENEKLLEIGNSPKSYADIDAQFMGLMKFNKRGVTDILDLCDRSNTKSENLQVCLNGKPVQKAYTTDLLNQLILEDIPVNAVKTFGNWIEVDTIADCENEVTIQRCKLIDEAIYVSN